MGIARNWQNLKILQVRHWGGCTYLVLVDDVSPSDMARRAISREEACILTRIWSCHTWTDFAVEGVCDKFCRTYSDENFALPWHTCMEWSTLQSMTKSHVRLFKHIFSTRVTIQLQEKSSWDEISIGGSHLGSRCEGPVQQLQLAASLQHQYSN